MPTDLYGSRARQEQVQTPCGLTGAQDDDILVKVYGFCDACQTLKLGRGQTLGKGMPL
jgi:hypothetical protein